MPDPAPPPSDPNDPQQVIASAWQDQALWSEVGNRLRESIDAWRFRAAAAGVAGVFLMVLVANLAPGTKGKPVLATLAVLLLALVPFLRQKLVSGDQLAAWTRARNVSEQLKAAIFRHLMGALDPVPLPDGSAPPDPTGPGNLVRQCRRIKEPVGDLALQASLTPIAPPSKPRPTTMTIDGYLKDRLENQIGYFRKAGLREAERAQRLQHFELVLGLLTVLVGALAGNLLPTDMVQLPTEVLNKLPDDVQKQLVEQSAKAPFLQPLLVLLAAMTAAVGAHMTGTRALELARQYFGMHELLRSLRDEWRVDPDRLQPARVLRLVREVEDALAREHDGWMTDWKALIQPAGGNAAGAPAPRPPAPAAPATVAAVAVAAGATVAATAADGAPASAGAGPQAEAGKAAEAGKQAEASKAAESGQAAAAGSGSAAADATSNPATGTTTDPDPEADTTAKPDAEPAAGTTEGAAKDDPAAPAAPAPADGSKTTPRPDASAGT